MDNKVVTTLTRAASAAALSTLRFDFRGVRASEGKYAEGKGERLDVLAALEHADRQETKGLRLLSGFSFGSETSTHVVNDGEIVDLLILVGPPLAKAALPRVPLPRHGLLAIVGDRDDFCSISQLAHYVHAYADPRARLAVIEGADHFFHGQLLKLTNIVYEAIVQAMER